MNELTILWRAELWHPLSVHFPVAFLLLATLCCLAMFFPRYRRWNEFLKKCRLLLLFTGTVTAWISILTGSLAYNVVVREFYDPSLLGTHQWWAYTATIIFTAVTLIEVLILVKLLKGNNFIQISIVLIMATGVLALAYASHLGATAVYDFGAGVQIP